MNMIVAAIIGSMFILILIIELFKKNYYDNSIHVYVMIGLHEFRSRTYDSFLPSKSSDSMLSPANFPANSSNPDFSRSEERRVGKECSS